MSPLLETCFPEVMAHSLIYYYPTTQHANLVNPHFSWQTTMDFSWLCHHTIPPPNGKIE